MYGKKQTVFLSVIGLLTLLFAIVGATFAYFTINVKGNEEASSIIIRTQKLGTIVFENGAEISMVNAFPGNIARKTFTVSLTDLEDENTTASYEVYLDQFTNEFFDEEIADFKHRIATSSTTRVTPIEGTVLGTLSWETVPEPTSTSPIFEGTLVGSDTHTYVYEIGLLETNINQNEAQGRTFIGKLRVEPKGQGKYTTDGSIWSSSE